LPLIYRIINFNPPTDYQTFEFNAINAVSVYDILIHFQPVQY